MAVLRGKLVVAQSGGPTAVFNNSACGVIQEALKHDDVFDGVYGASNGIMGILHETMIDLRKESPATIDSLRRTPASTLGTCRRKLDVTDLERILEVCKAHNIRYFFYNGGNDSMDTANKVSKMATDAGYEMRAFGIPKTVDNDLVETDHCPGFGSAARFMSFATRDVGRDTEAGAFTTTPINIMEVMGRDAAELWQEDTDTGEVSRMLKNNGAWSGVLTGVRKDTSTFRVYGMFHTIADGDGQGNGLVGTFIDTVPDDGGDSGQIIPE